MKEIFVVDGDLGIHQVQVEEIEWQKGGCTGRIGDQPILILRGGWNKLTTYAGFETREEAEAFKAAVGEQEAAESSPQKPQHTFGEFFDAMHRLAEESSNTDAELLMERWSESVSEEKWREAREMPLTAELILSFAEDMVSQFWWRLSTIEGEELYEMTIRDGHSFLKTICPKAKEFGFELDEKQVDRPLTPSDAIRMAQA